MGIDAGALSRPRRKGARSFKETTSITQVRGWARKVCQSLGARGRRRKGEKAKSQLDCGPLPCLPGDPSTRGAEQSRAEQSRGQRCARAGAALALGGQIGSVAQPMRNKTPGMVRTRVARVRSFAARIVAHIVVDRCGLGPFEGSLCFDSRNEADRPICRPIVPALRFRLCALRPSSRSLLPAPFDLSSRLVAAALQVTQGAAPIFILPRSAPKDRTRFHRATGLVSRSEAAINHPSTSDGFLPPHPPAPAKPPRAKSVSRARVGPRRLCEQCLVLAFPTARRHAVLRAEDQRAKGALSESGRGIVGRRSSVYDGRSAPSIGSSKDATEADLRRRDRRRQSESEVTGKWLWAQGHGISGNFRVRREESRNSFRNQRGAVDLNRSRECVFKSIRRAGSASR